MNIGTKKIYRKVCSVSNRKYHDEKHKLDYFIFRHRADEIYNTRDRTCCKSECEESRI